MNIDELKIQLQDHFSDGLVSIVGSGLSIAEGIPGMIDLQKHLENEIPKHNSRDIQTTWAPISDLLRSGNALEPTLNQSPPSIELETLIVKLTSNYILKFEQNIIQDVILGKKCLRFTRLLNHMLKPNNGIPVVTTNYDRLLEIAAEIAELGVDTMFCGYSIGKYDPRESRLSLCRDVNLSQQRKSVTLKYKPFVKLYKPHGSVDWYLLDDSPIRCPYEINAQKLMITPGLNKYISGYDRPFDKHREKANEAIDKATRFLIIGYGFNDSHLETHLTRQLKNGKPALMLTRILTDKAHKLIRECDNIIGLSAKPDNDGYLFTDKKQNEFISGPNIWDIGIFIDEVLEP